MLLLHGSDDVIIPPTEMLWLKSDIPEDDLVDALESSAIGHVEVGSKITLRQRLALVHWMAMMIHTARSTGAGPQPQGHAGRSVDRRNGKQAASRQARAW